MKVYYDSIHNACAVEFDKDEGVDMGVSEDGGIIINSYSSGKPEIVEKQLLFSLDELKDDKTN